MHPQPDVPDNDGPLVLSAKTIELSGLFGTVDWTLSDQFYGTLPVATCDDLCAKTGTRKIGPFFTQLAQRLLVHAGVTGVQLESLAQVWSMHTLTVECGIAGRINWQFPEGLWNAIPEDRRTALLKMLQSLIHGYMEEEICRPLIAYSIRKLTGGN